MKLNIISLVYYGTSEKSCTQQLIRESSFITEHLVRGLHKQSFFDCRRINFICTDNAPRAGIREYGGICEMDVSFHHEYFLMSKKEKEFYLFHLLYSSLSDLCELKKWDFSLFQILFHELENNHYSGEFYTKLHSRLNGIYVRLLGVQQIDKLSFYLEYDLAKNKAIRKFLFDSKPNVFDYDRFLGRLEWKSSYEIALIGKDNNEISVVNINIGQTSEG